MTNRKLNVRELKTSEKIVKSALENKIEIEVELF